MAYTHIQCIGYQVPTVAKVYDNTAPTAHDLPMPDIQDSNGNAILPAKTQILNHDGTIMIPIYNDAAIPKTLSQPPGIDDSDYLWWLIDGEMEDYLGRLIGYLEDPNNDDVTIRQQVQALVTYLKYYTEWGDWTIPSKNPNNKDVAIVKTTGSKPVDAYTLKDTADDDANLTVLNNNIDAKNRVIRFLNVLYKASDNSKVVKSENTTLKVFTAPEFYFRPETPINSSSIYHAYSEAVYKAIKEVLQQTIKSMSLKNWLIVPGTIMWYLPKGTAIPNFTSLADNTYFNSCIYIWSTATGSVKSRKLEKARASSIDGVPFKRWDYGANAPKMFPGYRDDAHLEQHLFDIDGVKTGIEICLEHMAYKFKDIYRCGVLVKVIYKIRSQSLRHLQLLVAGGMGINPTSIGLKNNKVFFRNDGLSEESLLISSSPETYDEKYVDARTNTAPPFMDHTHLTALAVAATVKLNEEPAFELRSPMLEANYQLEEYLPFDQQNIVIFRPQKI